MTELEKNKISKVIFTFGRFANVDDERILINYINELSVLSIDDCIDKILVSLSDLVNRKVITLDDISNNISLLLDLNPLKYNSFDDLMKRLKWIKSMNLEYPNMPLNQNHKLITEIFDKFNELIQDKFDCYYTGGLMGYLATNHELERYHSDLDLFFNEEELFDLKKLIDSSEDFSFVSNMEHKQSNGHEYKITYKDSPITIGLFLFQRNKDNSFTLKEYNYFNNELYANEHHLSKKYTKLSFSDKVMFHNGFKYKMMSLENIYNCKKNSRPKDRYDASIIKDYVNEDVEKEIINERKNNYDIINVKIENGIINTLEENNNIHL